MRFRKFPYTHTSKILMFSLASLFILQCKQDTKTIPARVSANADGTCTMSFGLTDPFNLGPVVKIDASKLQVEESTVVTMDYIDDQKTVLLQVNPKSSDDPNMFPDYAAYKITNENNKDCLTGQTGASLFAEIYIPPACSGSVLQIRTQACALSNRLKDPNTACGPIQSVPYSNEPNAKRSRLGNILSLTQQNERELGLIARWLGGRATTFLNKVGSNPGTLSNAQQTVLSLAQLFARQQTDFVEIFSSHLYSQLETSVREQSEASKGAGLKLAETGSSCPSGSYGTDGSATPAQTAAQAQIGKDLGKGETQTDLESILKNARENYGATGNPMSLAELDAGATDTDLTTSASEMTNAAQKVDMVKSSPVGMIVGGVLLGVGVLWGAYFIGKTIVRSRAQAKREFFLGEKAQLITEGPDGKVKTADLKMKNVKWWGTADGQSKVYSYKSKHQLLVEVKSFDEKGVEIKTEPKKYKTVTDKQMGIEVSKKHFYSFTKEAISKPLPQTAPDAPEAKITEPFKVSNSAIADAKISTTKAIQDNLRTAHWSHTIGVGILIAAGVTLMAISGGVGLAEESTDPFRVFVKDMVSAQTAVQRLRAENDALQEAKTGIVIDKLTSTP